MKPSVTGLVAVLILLGLPTLTAAETFVLSSGGRLEGELLNPDEKPRQNYVIKLASGGKVTLTAGQVKEVIGAKPEQSEYDKVRPTYPDTAEGQWDLAEWCHKRELKAERKKHMERVIELDPNHKAARVALGYYLVNGQWKTMQEIKNNQGLVRYKGQFKMQQEIELEEAKRKKELAETAWFKKIQQWRGWLGKQRDQQARENIAGIDDPLAVKALAVGVLKTERSDEVRLLYIEALGKIKAPEAATTLAIVAIDDPVEEVRLTCLDYLKKKDANDRNMAVKYFIMRLVDNKSSNAIINRAGLGLGRMKDPSAIAPLIKALISYHTRTTGPAGNMSMSFGSNGGIGFGAGQKPKAVTERKYNQAVLDALVGITGQNFSYDQRAWNTWHANQKKAAETLDARRG